MKSPTGFRAAAYARYSTCNQTKLSIERQLYGIDQYCETAGLTITGYYADEAETGTNMDRSEFQRLLNDAERGLFDTVVIYDMQRGSRDIGDWFFFRKEMKRLGIQVISVTNRLGDIDNPDDFLQEGVTAILGQHQVLQYRRDSIGGKKARARKGMFCGGYAPLGYDVIDGYYVINEREAAVVRMIFDMYASGSSYKDILSEVYKTGVTGKFGHPIESNTLYYILKNERYTGTYVWFEYEMRHMHKWVGKKNDDQDTIRLENAIPQIVPTSIFQAAQTRLKNNKKNCMNHAKDRYYLFSGLIRCGNCQGVLAGMTATSKGMEYKRYTCINKRKQKNCKAHDIRADKLESFIIDFLRSRVLVPEFLTAMVDRVISGAKQSGERDSIKNEIQSIDRKNANLYLAIENGLATQETISRINENAKRKKELEDKLARIPTVKDIDRSAIMAVLMADVSRAFDSPASQREMIQRYIKSITIYDGYIDLVVSPNLARYTTGSNKKVFTSSPELVNTVGSPGVNYAVFTNITEYDAPDESDIGFHIPRQLVA